MSTLISGVYTLTLGETVKAKVQAENGLGWGELSEPNVAGGTIQTVPGKMNTPVRGSTTSTTSVDVTWSAVAITGDSAIDTYNLQWDQGSGVGIWDDVQGEIGSEDTSLQGITPATPGETY